MSIRLFLVEKKDFSNEILLHSSWMNVKCIYRKYWVVICIFPTPTHTHKVYVLYIHICYLGFLFFVEQPNNHSTDTNTLVLVKPGNNQNEKNQWRKNDIEERYQN